MPLCERSDAPMLSFTSYALPCSLSEQEEGAWMCQGRRPRLRLSGGEFAQVQVRVHTHASFRDESRGYVAR